MLKQATASAPPVAPPLADDGSLSPVSQPPIEDDIDATLRHLSQQFTPDMLQSVASVLGRKDLLDDPQFNATAFINETFPDESSLTILNEVQVKLAEKLQRIDRDLRSVIRGQTNLGDDGLQHLHKAHGAISDLVAKIGGIRQRAQTSEQTVHDITADMKRLDCAKRHLTTSVTALKRLQMLSGVSEQLKTMMKRRQYSEAAPLVQVVGELVQQFGKYSAVGKVGGLLDSVRSLQDQMQRQIMDEFDVSFSQQGTLTGNAQQLSSACIAMAAVSSEAKQKLVDWYCDLQLRDYRAIFRSSSEVATLDNVPRRFAWLKRLMKTFDEEQSTIFPADWRIGELLCERFCVDTKRDLIDLLAKEEKNLDVKLLVRVLKETAAFEQQLVKRHEQLAQLSNDDPNTSDQSQRFTRMISTCFEPYLSLLIEAEDKHLSELVEKMRKQPDPPDDALPVFSSSTDLFLAYRQALINVSTVTTQRPLLDLSQKVFCKYLTAYAELLTGRLEPAVQSKRAMVGAAATAVAASVTGAVVSATSAVSSATAAVNSNTVNVEEIKTLCLVLNTADYVCTTARQLQNKVQEKLDAVYKEKVDYEKELETLMGVVTAAVKSLVKNLDVLLDAPMAVMQRYPWQQHEAVGDQSPYVTDIGGIFLQFVPVVRRSLMQTRWYRSFCDKFVDAFGQKFVSALQRLRNVRETAAEQLLLDTQALKSMLLDLPQLDASNDASQGAYSNESSHAPPATYGRLVQRGMAKCEVLLKLLLTPLQPVEGFVDHYLVLYADTSLNNLQKMLDLKGVKRTDQQPYLDVFQKRLPPPPEEHQSTPIPPPPPPQPTAAASTNSTSVSSTAAALFTMPSLFGGTNATTPSNTSSIAAPVPSAAGTLRKFMGNLQKRDPK